MPKPSALVVYMPVLHRGYLQLFEAFQKNKSIFVIGPDLLKKTDYIRKDLRALTPERQVSVIKALGIFENVEMITNKNLSKTDDEFGKVIFPDEDISRDISKKFKKAEVEFYPIFLRWDRRSAEDINQTDPDEKITTKQLHKILMRKANQNAKNSSDIWRRVGAVLVNKNGKFINFAVNKGEPTEHSPWMEGDPRNIFNRGVAIEMSLFTHAEAALISEAAKKGTSTEGGAIYVSTFPCPACAKLIAHSGIKTCYYAEGYSVLDGKRLLNDYRVEVIKVDGVEPADNYEDSNAWVPYKKS